MIILKYVQCGINRNIVRLFERHKPSPRPNTIILIKVIAVTNDKHSEHDIELACSVFCTTLETLRHRKLHCTPWSTRTRKTHAIWVRFNCWYSLEDFRSMSPQRWSVWVGCSSLGHTDTAECSIGPVALSGCSVQIQVKLSVQLLQYHGLTASLWLVQCCLLYWVWLIQLTCHCRNL